MRFVASHTLLGQCNTHFRRRWRCAVAYIAVCSYVQGPTTRRLRSSTARTRSHRLPRLAPPSARYVASALRCPTHNLGLIHVPCTAQAMQTARMEKQLSQKDVAQKINEKPSVLQDYEAGRAIPNPQILAKLERVLGVKLRGNDIGKKLEGPKKS